MVIGILMKVCQISPEKNLFSHTMCFLIDCTCVFWLNIVVFLVMITIIVCRVAVFSMSNQLRSMGHGCIMGKCNIAE